MESDNTPLDLVDGLLLVEMRLQDLCRMIDIEPVALNPHFFDLMRRLARAGRNLIEQAR